MQSYRNRILLSTVLLIIYYLYMHSHMEMLCLSVYFVLGRHPSMMASHLSPDTGMQASADPESFSTTTIPGIVVHFVYSPSL